MVFSLQHEIQAVLEVGATLDRIVYANPCKQASHLKYAAKTGVSLMTFDNKTELLKVKKLFPSARCVRACVCVCACVRVHVLVRVCVRVLCKWLLVAMMTSYLPSMMSLSSDRVGA